VTEGAADPVNLEAPTARALQDDLHRCRE